MLPCQGVMRITPETMPHQTSRTHLCLQRHVDDVTFGRVFSLKIEFSVPCISRVLLHSRHTIRPVPDVAVDDVNINTTSKVVNAGAKL